MGDTDELGYGDPDEIAAALEEAGAGDWESFNLPSQASADDDVTSVEFPWGSASTALADLSLVINSLKSAMDNQPSLEADHLDENEEHVAWSGGFRDEFDGVMGDLHDEYPERLDELRGMGNGVIGVAGLANLSQRALNAAGPEEDD